MNILLTVTYYHPNTSGLTIYAQILAEELSKNGHKVVVLTSQYDKNLSREEFLNGVLIIRVPVNVQIGKGVLMFSLPVFVFKYVQWADIVNCHLPQFESSLIVLIAKLFNKKVVLTHHTDLSGWRGLFNRISEFSVYISQLIAGSLADKIIVYTKDYADYSDFLQKFKDKLCYVYPPIKIAPINKTIKLKLKKKIGHAKYLIGFSGRIAKQKGIPYLLNSIQYLKSLGSFKIVFAGPYKDIIGENYFDEIQNLINKYKKYTVFLGPLKCEELSSFYTLLDVLVLPSDDRLESFGFVQVEAMLNGCPVVATNLPGARIPVLKTGMGKIVGSKNPQALAEGIIDVINRKNVYVMEKDKVKTIFDYNKTLEKYEELIIG